MDYEKIEQAARVLDENGSDMSTLAELSFDLEVEEVASEEVASEEVASEEVASEDDSSALIREFFESKLGGPEELEMKKLMVLSTVAAGSDASAEELASQVDASATCAKVSYKTSTGELDIIEAIDIIIDRGAARLNTFIQSNLDMDVAGEAISEMIVTAYPPARAAKPFIKALVKKAEPVVRKCVEKGIKAVSTYAKQTVRKVATRLKDFAKSMLKA